MTTVRFIKKPKTKFATVQFLDWKSALNFKRKNPTVHLNYQMEINNAQARWQAKWKIPN